MQLYKPGINLNLRSRPYLHSNGRICKIRGGCSSAWQEDTGCPAPPGHTRPQATCGSFLHAHWVCWDPVLSDKPLCPVNKGAASSPSAHLRSSSSWERCWAQVLHRWLGRMRNTDEPCRWAVKAVTSTCAHASFGGVWSSQLYMLLLLLAIFLLLCLGFWFCLVFFFSWKKKRKRCVNLQDMWQTQHEDRLFLMKSLLLGKLQNFLPCHWSDANSIFPACWDAFHRHGIFLKQEVKETKYIVLTEKVKKKKRKKCLPGKTCLDSYVQICWKETLSSQEVLSIPYNCQRYF